MLDSFAMATPAKRKRATLSLMDKLKILDRLQTGESASAIGREFGLGESTIRGIKLKEVKIRNSAQSAVAGRISYLRDPILEKTEKSLFSWVEDLNQGNVPLCANLIRAEARKIYLSFQRKAECEKESSEEKNVFRASKGWFERFKSRYGLDKVKISGEIEELEPVESIAEEIQRIVAAAHADGGEDLPDKTDEVDECHKPEGELIRIDREEPSEEELRKSIPVCATSEPSTNLNLKAVNELLQKREEMMKIVMDLDSNLERKTEFRKALDVTVAPYIDLQRKLHSLSGQKS